MKRGLNLVKKVEAEKFIKRFEIYNKLGDIKIYSDSSPQKIAELMEHTIATFLPSQPT